MSFILILLGRGQGLSASPLSQPLVPRPLPCLSYLFSTAAPKDMLSLYSGTSSAWDPSCSAEVQDQSCLWGPGRPVALGSPHMANRDEEVGLVMVSEVVRA